MNGISGLLIFLLVSAIIHGEREWIAFLKRFWGPSNPGWGEPNHRPGGLGLKKFPLMLQF